MSASSSPEAVPPTPADAPAERWDSQLMTPSLPRSDTRSVAYQVGIAASESAETSASTGMKTAAPRLVYSSRGRGKWGSRRPQRKI